METSPVRERMLALRATFLAALALVLSCIGVYGVMAYAKPAAPGRSAFALLLARGNRA